MDAPAIARTAERLRPRAQRTFGALRLSYRRRGPRSLLAGAYRAGASRILEPAGSAPVAEGVLINTAGGIAGGDRFEVALDVGEAASALLTTQACEKVYRAAADDPDAAVETRATLGAGAALAWLPQPTILFDGARLTRRIAIDMDATARCLALESVILGRQAMGETVERLSFLDGWRIRRGGRLVFADATRLRGAVPPATAGPATLAGARAFALLVCVDPDPDRFLGPVRDALSHAPASGGASAWNGLLAVRLVAADGRALAESLRTVVPVLHPGGVPRMWTI